MDIKTILQIVLIILGIALVAGLIYYVNLLNNFKKLIKFEQQVKANPNDALIKQYMILYKKTFFPKKDQLLASRARFYYTIKENPQVSYETKKALRIFLESEGVNLLSGIKAKQTTADDIMDDIED